MPLDEVTLLSLVISIVDFCLVIWVVLIIRHDVSRSVLLDQKLDIYSLVDQFSARVKELEKEVVNERINREILALRLVPVRSISTDIEQAAGHLKKLSPETARRDRTGGVKLTTLEQEILKFVRERGKVTAAEVQGYVMRSREHTAREMGSLSNRGFVIRESSVRPFRYFLSARGEAALG